jgi:hypothetical protein
MQQFLKPEPEFLTTKQAADRIGRPPDWLFRARKTPGVGPPFYRIGRQYYYRPAEIMSWLRSCRGQ